MSSEVRACICLQLHYVAENLDSESIMSALLPSLVELASDEESSVRYASVQSIVDLMSHLQEGKNPNVFSMRDFDSYCLVTLQSKFWEMKYLLQEFSNHKN